MRRNEKSDVDGPVPSADEYRYRKVGVPMQRQGASKRQKERARQEKQREKDAVRIERRKDKSARDPHAPGEDPDIAGIIPGPQPPVVE